ncbi:MAG: fasciclin domain-containing protein [Chloroflexi bacterium]|nr:fasciclin domain-containing protein [Chloroflexota bacterium]
MAGIIAVIAAGVLTSSALAATDLDRGPGAVAPAQATTDIVDTAVAAGNFTTLATALEAAGLIETLKGAGSFTVFAPTDAAFAALPAGALDGLLADPEALKQVLLYHVVAGSVDAATVSGLTEAGTVNGASVTISVSGGTVTLNGLANVTTADIMASDGIIHVIDAVLIPPTAAEAPAPAATGNAGLVGANGSNSGLLIALLATAAVVLIGDARLVSVRTRSGRS